MILAREGVLFIATICRYLQVAASSANASRTWLDGRPSLYAPNSPSWLRRLVLSITCTATRSLGSYRDMIAPLLSLPYTRTLFLDTDARLSAPVRRPDGWSSASVPALFPELNSGVLLMRRSWRQRLLVRRWLHLYEQLQA